jgi:gamma-glutamyl:cysteine ligase YbdK (ATP-grasp superfamily)
VKEKRAAAAGVSKGKSASENSTTTTVKKQRSVTATQWKAVQPFAKAKGRHKEEVVESQRTILTEGSQHARRLVEMQERMQFLEEAVKKRELENQSLKEGMQQQHARLSTKTLRQMISNNNNPS